MFFTSVFAFAALSYFIYSLYQRLLPRPIPGIPYNVDATSSLFGDIPRFQQETKSSNLFKWLIRQSRVHQTPIFQAFIEPLRKPTVVLVDFREGQDVLMRRKEFDRSDFTIDTLSGEAPTFHINLKTGPEWKAHRRLLQDLMSPKFLHEVAAPNIYKSSTQLLKLWKKKTQITGGKPFEAEMDIFYAALDAVVDFGFGDSVEQRALSCQIEAMDGYESKCQKAAEGTFFDFPIAPIDQYLQAMLNSADNVGPVSASGWPKLAWWLISWKPSVQRNRAIIDEFTRHQLIKAAKRYTNGKANDSDDFVKSAIDLMVQREGTAANKEGREPVFWNRTMRDETLGFIVAGHDTTSTTLCWGTKFLADNQNCQTRLRESLRSAHASALSESRAPAYSEIVQTSVPYLDAVVEEILRLAHTAIIQERQAKEDTVVLGHLVPKGTTVLIPNQGASFTEPAFDIAEILRSPSCQTAAKERGPRAWDPEDMDKFQPERWLTTAEGGQETFDSSAGPILPFGLGLRGCFGRRLAYMELKLLVTLLVWTFEFLPCPNELSSYEDIEGLTRKPKQCFVSLKVI